MRRTLTHSIFAFVLLSVGCDAAAPSGGADSDAMANEADRGAIGKADLIGSCEDACGGQSWGTCYCDELCWAFDDCCIDLVRECPDVASESREQLEELLIAVAEENTERTDNLEGVRATLEYLVSELGALSHPLDEATVLEYSPGSWRQIWSDENNEMGGPPAVRSQVYQYVSPELWAYNFGVRSITPEVQVTFALAVTASIEGVEQTTRIDAGFSRPSALQPGESIRALAESIEKGTSTDFAEQELGEFPKGPIGAEGVLTLLYVDDTIKVGVADNVFTGESEMYVLLRSDMVESLD